MGLDLVPAGRRVPDEINVIIEIPMNSEPVKYEVDKESGAIFVDRVLTTPMRYPCNYGYIPNTLSGDGDPADVLVVMPLPLIPGSVIRVRPLGMLKMTDEAGEDTKIVAVPISKVYSGYDKATTIDDLPEHWRERIGHFFEHYKDLEKGKWVKVEGWAGADAARAEILAAIERHKAAKPKPNF
jgi:inorganic pyrophosphatase